MCELILEQINKIDKINNKIFNVGGGIKNSISLKQLTSKVQKITKNNIKIGRKLKTSIYDIPYYVTNNKKIYYYYNWRVKKNIDDILNDTFQILSKNKQSFIKLEK